MTAHQPIVVGVDGQSALAAVTWAAREAVYHDAPLVLVTVTSMPGDSGVPTGIPAGFFDDQGLAARKRLEKAEEFARAAAHGHDIDIEIARSTGSPTRELLERSETARMVVVGSNRYGPVERALLGSVSTAVVTHARCPVAVVRELPHTEVTEIVGPVVVGVDGTANSEPAISVAFEEAAQRQVGLVAVHAWSDIDLDLAGWRGSGFEWEKQHTREMALLAESLSGRAEEYPDVKVQAVVVIDRPVHNLRAQAERAQLLVVGSRGRGGFASMLLGSTSRALLHTVTCPLIVAR
ncbi:universal stress protein [Rhodococcus sp. T7]|uniref:universal stress protein n=1 Tax=Rhodococcus sp. T7 TaxID=627444 RepID=UPI001356DF5C|nr:universal stress protein [Rhodococcus sp. T7]KAF0961133.1 Universal stress protein [Rhodococcus sp. T7]